jgi:predicted DNA-binding transcriptional regulator YafY
MSNQLPQTTILAEASPESFTELMNRDPLGFTRQDRDAIVAALRAHRERLEKTAASAPTKVRKAIALSSPADAQPVSDEDLGI